jgi:hypothetical protein
VIADANHAVASSAVRDTMTTLLAVPFCVVVVVSLTDSAASMLLHDGGSFIWSSARASPSPAYGTLEMTAAGAGLP